MIHLQELELVFGQMNERTDGQTDVTLEIVFYIIRRLRKSENLAQICRFCPKNGAKIHKKYRFWKMIDSNITKKDRLTDVLVEINDLDIN